MTVAVGAFEMIFVPYRRNTLPFMTAGATKAFPRPMRLTWPLVLRAIG